jgi:hypothetical protein
VYVRQDGKNVEHVLPTHPLLDFQTAEHQAALDEALAGFLTTRAGGG